MEQKQNEGTIRRISDDVPGIVFILVAELGARSTTAARSC
jgi:hypothetical protein